MTKRDKVTVDDIIGIVHTDETTNSVEEVCKLRGRKNITEKRFTIFGEWHKDCVIDEIRDNTGEYVTIGRVVDLLNENEQLKKDCSNLIDDNTEYVSEMNHIKQVIKEAYETERTHIGRNVLKQLLNNIGETNE